MDTPRVRQLSKAEFRQQREIPLKQKKEKYRMPFYDETADLWAFPHIDDVTSLFDIRIQLDAECEVVTITYQGRQARFSTEGWVGLSRTSEPHVYFDFLMQIEVSSYGGDFQGWAISHDRVVDERRTHVLWRYYRLLTSRLQRLFAEDFAYIMGADIDMPRDEGAPAFSPQLVERFTAVVQTTAASPEHLGPQEVEPLMRQAQNQGWGSAFRHWLLSCAALGEQTRHALLMRKEREAPAG